MASARTGGARTGKSYRSTETIAKSRADPLNVPRLNEAKPKKESTNLRVVGNRVGSREGPVLLARGDKKGTPEPPFGSGQ